MAVVSTRFSRFIGHLLCVLLAFSLAACKEELYNGLSEKEGNEMLSILLESGIDAEKVPQSKGHQVNLMVDGTELARAISVLKSRGYPRDEFASVGDMFKKDGLISSPLEERARYIYARSQELAATLSQLDGVITARVHVVVPEESDKKTPLSVSSASVFIKHASSVKLDEYVPQIKMLINNGIEGLQYDNISVALFPTQALPQQPAPAMASFLSIQVAASSIDRLYTLVGVGFALLVLSAMFSLNLYLKMKKRRTALMAAG